MPASCDPAVARVSLAPPRGASASRDAAALSIRGASASRDPIRLLLRRAVAPAAVAILAGCDGPQSALQPDGPAASVILNLGWGLLALSTFVVLLVVATLLWAIVRPRRFRGELPPLPLSPDLPARRHEGKSDAELGGERGAGVLGEPIAVSLDNSESDRRSVRWVLAGGLVFPVIALSVLFVFTLTTLGALTLPGSTDLTIDVIGKQFWWQVRYSDVEAVSDFETANEIHIPVGRRVLLRLHSPDVIHSFWVPRLHGKMDLIPGRMNSFWIQADRPGVYRGQCAEYCGVQHARMSLLVIAQEEPEFLAWARGQASPAAPPADSVASAGRDVFLSTACAACHAVRGTPATSEFGPDLTHVASRRTLGAVTLDNGIGAMGGWIADPQHIKPGVRMPAVPLDGDSFNALLHYMMSLR
jgi:cytochrome c oxidase subunit II